ncbi:hypothetical protein HMI54_000389 [Coelomomyces lativittatus]|nr:hypothetical protein HMI55_006769 [Coelomomyces lativittatus]KAJ1511953.1 hypothetical protein HMI54_000389 [Coelomomyces lativittatus]
MSSLNLKNWRDLAQNTEYVPPHLSLVEVQCNTPKTVPFTNLSHLREAQAIQVQLKSRKRSSENKNSHEIYMPDYPKSNRSSKTLDALVQEIEKSQKNDIRTRLSGHLNEKHVYEAMHSIPCSIPFSNEPLLKKVNSLVDVHQIDEPLPKNLSQSEVSELIEKVPEQSATSPRMRHSTCPLFSEKKENVTCSANNHTKNKDKIFRLHHQMKNELLQDRHPLAQLAVAGQYFENIIQDFRVYSPLFSEIKVRQ